MCSAKKNQDSHETIQLRLEKQARCAHYVSGLSIEYGMDAITANGLPGWHRAGRQGPTT